MGSLADRLAAETRTVRILTLDIETMHAKLRGFGLRNQFFSISQIDEPVRVIMTAAKWLGQPAMAFSEWDDGGPDVMLERSFQVMSEADVIITYNGDGFDFRHLQWEFALRGWTRPKPFKSIDLFKVVRRNFRPMSMKLDFVSQQLGIGAKVQHSGDSLWAGVDAGDERARAKMVRYAKGDVNLTEKLYLRLLPWLPSNVNLPLIAGLEDGCPNCGSPKFKPGKDDYTYTALTSYVLYQCANKACGAWVRSNLVKNRTTRRVVR